MYDANVVDKLIDIEKKILLSFVKLSSYERNSKLFFDEFYFLRDVLIKKEEILISKLPLNIGVLNDILDNVKENKSVFFDDECFSYFVLERFSSVISDLTITLESEADFDDDCDFDYLPKYYKKIRDNLSLLFLEVFANVFEDEELKDMLDIIKYYEVFTSKKVSNLLVNNGFDFENLLFMNDSQMKDNLDLDFDDYLVLKDDEICNSLEDLSLDLLDVFDKGDDSLILSYMLFKFKFLIRSVSDDMLLVFKDYFYGMFLPFKENSFVDSFIFSLDFEVKKRGLADVDNCVSPKLDEFTLSLLIKLIKTSGKIYELFKNMDINSFDDKDLAYLKSCVSLEDYLVTKINVDSDNEGIIRSIISDMDFFLSLDDDELEIVSRRIFDIIPYFHNLGVSPTQSTGSYNYIARNHIIRCFKKYLNFRSDRADFSRYLKELIYSNGFLTSEFMVTGNYMMIEDLSDVVVSQLLDIDYKEYSFDRDEQLMGIALDIIYDDFDDDFDVYFSFLELDDIMKSLSDDYLDEFMDEIVHSDFYKEKIVKKMGMRLKFR